MCNKETETEPPLLSYRLWDLSTIEFNGMTSLIALSNTGYCWKIYSKRAPDSSVSDQMNRKDYWQYYLLRSSTMMHTYIERFY